MTPTANLAPAEADAPHGAAPAAEADSFVLNLCSSTTPMALPQTDLPELKRFTFFVSRRFEEGRERFRLHMGFFTSQAEAEEWLGLVRDIYPGAWAGEAPGKKLRARATAAAAAQAQHTVGPQTTAASAGAPAPGAGATPVAALASAPPAAAPAIPRLVPTLHPPAPVSAPAPAASARAPAASAAKPAAQLAPQRSAAPAAAPRAVAPAARAAQRPVVARQPAIARPAAASSPPQARSGVPAPALQRPASRSAPIKPAAQTAAVAAAARARSAAATARAAPQSAARGAPQPAKKPIFADSNVKEVLAALGSGEDAADTRLMPSLTAPGRTEDSALTDTQVLRFLETRRAADGNARSPSAPQLDAHAESGISLLKPDDTGTRQALKEAVRRNEPVSFAVQLQWSVQAVELDKVPPLAIFSAYTLYSVEGSREGRKWYGLRLGFFNDAVSAKQVAHYIRSDFTSVAVVPVSPQERERATADSRRFPGVGGARKRRQPEENEFKLIDSDDAPRATQAAPAVSPAPAAPPPAAQRSGRKGGGKVGARERRTPQTLEETLEILGANELAIADGRDELNDTGVRHLRVEIQKNTPFSRLIERLSERVRKS